MSSQKGNAHRTRPQKYQNHFAFKNSLHDTSHKTKTINSLQIHNVCERCKKILEWKIKYKKYKPMKAAGKCNKCDQKTVRHSYHTMCGPCARERNVCPKCGDGREIVEPVPSKEEQLKLDAEMQNMLKSLPERKRRTFLRFLDSKTDKKKKRKQKRNQSENKVKNYNEEESDNGQDNEEEEEDDKPSECTREDLLNKLKSLMVDEEKDNDDLSSDFSDDDSDFTEYDFDKIK